jgi:hypothetical protein
VATERTVLKPNWLTPLRDAMERLGLSEQEEIFATNSERLFLLTTKVNVEVMREAPTLLAGYQLWLLQDYYGIYQGFLTQDLQFKRALNISSIRNFQRGVVVLAPGFWELSSTSVSAISTPLAISNFGEHDLLQVSIHWSVEVGEKEACTGQQ